MNCDRICSDCEEIACPERRENRVKINNFRDLVVTGINIEKKHTATVDVTTGMLWWKRIESRKIARNFADKWFFVDTGEYTPNFDVEALERGYLARQELTNIS